MISGLELIQSLKAMSSDDLLEIARIITSASRPIERTDASQISGLRGHNLFLRSLRDCPDRS
jgi:hypothetical protein